MIKFVLFAVNIKEGREKILFFSIPKLDKNVYSKRDREIVRRRITASMAVIGSNIYKYYGTHTVCSLHFHSGMQSLQT
jgi:hypothetical protein